MDEKLTYVFRDENFNQEWHLPANPHQTPLDALDRNPDRQNGCDGTLTLHSDERFTHRFQILKNETHIDEAGGMRLEGIHLDLTVQINRIHAGKRSDQERQEAAREFSRRLRQRHAELMQLFVGRMTAGMPPGGGFLDVWDCEVLNDVEDECILFIFRVNPGGTEEVLSWDWNIWAAVFSGLHGCIEDVNVGIRLF